MTLRTLITGTTLSLAASLAACGGGGGSSAGRTGSIPATPTPTPTPTSRTVSGAVIDRASGTPLSGFTVTLGSTPNPSTCLAAQSGTSQPCGVIALPGATATTAADGSFSLTTNASGVQMLTIGKDGTYATLHRTVTLNPGTVALGTLTLTALDAAHQAWLADVNNQRLAIAYPASFPNLVVDEYAQEQADKWAADVASGATQYGDAGYAPYQTAYGQQQGAMYGATGVLRVLYAETLAQGDSEWMSEKNNDPSHSCAPYGGNWQTCLAAATTTNTALYPYVGHYVNMSNTQDVWVGLGTTSTVNATLGGKPTDIMIIQNVATVGPAVATRVAR